jgi:hypothetical protein
MRWGVIRRIQLSVDEHWMRWMAWIAPSCGCKVWLAWKGGAAGRGCLDEMNEMDFTRRIQLSVDEHWIRWMRWMCLFNDEFLLKVGRVGGGWLMVWMDAWMRWLRRMTGLM